MLALRCGGLCVWSFAVICLSAASASAQVNAMSGTRLPAESVLKQHGLTRPWWGQAVTNSARDRVQYLGVDEGTLYVQSTSGSITAMDAESGKRLWSTQVGRVDSPNYPAVANLDSVFVVSGTRLYALNKSSGLVLWDMGMPGQPTTSPTVDEHRLYAGFLDGSMYAFDLRKIRELFAKGMMPEYGYSSVMWRYKTSKSIAVPAVTTNRLLLFASRNGSMYSVTKDDRDLIFQFETDAPLSAPMARYGDSLLLASEDYNLYSVNAENGRYNWQYATGNPIRRAPVVINDEVYVMPEGGGILKIRPDNGQQIWLRPRVIDFLAASPGRVYARNLVGDLVILDRDDGALLGTVRMDRFSNWALNDRSDRLYLSTNSGLVVCLREIGRDFPVYHQHPELLPILPEFVSPEEAARAEQAPPAADPPDAAEGEPESSPADADAGTE